MSLRPLANKMLVSYARPEAYVERTVAILARLGYRIVDVAAWVSEQAADARDGAGGAANADLLIIDESRFEEVRSPRPGSSAAELPILLLTGRHGIREQDPRIVGAVMRPCGLHDLYRLLQQLFEDTPRSTPRVDTDLAVVCTRGDLEWKGRLVSLSENGGLMRTSEDLPLGSRFRLSFELSGHGPLEVRAEAAYQIVPNLGVVFSGLEPITRAALHDFVSQTILAA
ncbi:MAG: PilZ domain-containing protein [Deltaproteobacteria bacterium]|nr:PilZ domain-containing protein [Deltaproteobacteria bacterium]